MASNDLVFTKNELGRYESTFVSSGEKVSIQMERKTEDCYSVLCNVEGMDPVPVYTSGGTARKNVIFTVDVPTGMEVTVVSMSEVVQAKIMK